MVLTITRLIGPSQGNGRYKIADIIAHNTTTSLLFCHRSATIPQKVEPATKARFGKPTTKPRVLKSPKALACNLTIVNARP